jgi:hypothetical protein
MVPFGAGQLMALITDVEFGGKARAHGVFLFRSRIGVVFLGERSVAFAWSGKRFGPTFSRRWRARRGRTHTMKAIAARVTPTATTANSKPAIPSRVAVDGEAEVFEVEQAQRKGGRGSRGLSDQGEGHPSQDGANTAKMPHCFFPSLAADRAGVDAHDLRMEAAAPRSLQQNARPLD